MAVPLRGGTSAPRGSFQARLSGLVALAVLIAVAIAALASYLVVDRQLYGNVNSTLQDEYASCTNGDPHALPGCINQIVRSGGVVAVYTQQGEAVAVPFDQSLLNNQPNIAPTKAQLALAGQQADELSNVTLGGRHYRLLTGGVPGGLLLIAEPLDAVRHTLAHLRLLLGLVVALGVAVAVLLGSGIALATLRPVKRLTEAAEHVAATQQLDAHIDVERNDELGRLAGSFNEMLAALRLSRQQQAQLVSDAGHELRTPLTSLRTNIELLMRADDLPPADRRELLGDVRDQLEELTALVGDIVETARQDERPTVEPTEVRLDTLVGRALDRARRRAPSLRWESRLEPGEVRAQPALLERAVLNVLDNAAKWSPPGGQVDVDLRRDGTWSLTVGDRGPGIDPADLPHIFDRFYRAPSARAMPGSGLGLAIVAGVVADHGGTVDIGARPGGGTLVTITLPTVDEDEPTREAASSAWGPPAAADPLHN